MAMLEDIFTAERIVTALVLLTGMGVVMFCLLCPSRRISFAVVGITSVLAFGAISATFFNSKAEFSVWDAENPEFSGRSRTRDGRATIRLKYSLENAANGKYLISGKLKIRDSMTRKEWTIAAKSSVFITGCESAGTFELLYALPKELADRSMGATYTGAEKSKQEKRSVNESVMKERRNMKRKNRRSQWRSCCPPGLAIFLLVLLLLAGCALFLPGDTSIFVPPSLLMVPWLAIILASLEELTIRNAGLVASDGK